MKSALKIHLLIALLAVVFSLNAQVYRLELGVNNPYRYGNVKGLINYFDGIKLGATAEYNLKNNFSLLTGALYNFIYSDNFQGNPNSLGVTYTTYGHSLDIPIRLTYTYPLNKSLKLFGFAGPNLNIGLFQNMKITSTQTYDSSNPYYVKPRSVDLYNGNDSEYQLNRLNLQIGLGGGVQWKKYQLKAGYDFGINNLNKLNSGNLNQEGWYISVAYEF
jgi:hypothetical protein